MAPDWTMCGFVDGELVARHGDVPVHGPPERRAGADGRRHRRGTLPAYRRRGLLRQIMGKGLEVCHERGESLAILWASMGAIYQRFGYGLATTQVTYEFDPRYAGFAAAAPSAGTVQLESTEDAFPVMKQLYIDTPRRARCSFTGQSRSGRLASSGPTPRTRRCTRPSTATPTASRAGTPCTSYGKTPELRTGPGPDHAWMCATSSHSTWRPTAPSGSTSAGTI